MKRVMKRLLCVATASVVLLSSELSTNAAGLKDIFCAEYYAEQYPDLKAAFGYNEKALYQHFLTYGIKEGRVMNPIIDIVKYRECYEDLQAAFDDDWDAYVKHYFEYGINERRENGTDFNLLAYLAAYTDVKEVFGDDYVAIAKHYVEYGISEGRDEGSKEVIAAREAAKGAEEVGDTDITQDTDSSEDKDITQDAENPGDADGSEDAEGSEGTDGAEDTDSSESADMEGDVDQSEVCYENIVNHDDGSWTVEQYDDGDILLKKINYSNDGSIEYYATFVFDDNLILRERVTYIVAMDIYHRKEYNEYGISFNNYYYNLVDGKEEILQGISSAWGNSGEVDLDLYASYEYDETTKVLKVVLETAADHCITKEYAPNGICTITDDHFLGSEYVQTQIVDEKELTDVELLPNAH